MEELSCRSIVHRHRRIYRNGETQGRSRHDHFIPGFLCHYSWYAQWAASDAVV